MGPYFGCGSCAPQFFMRKGLCVACPASPPAQLVGLLLVVLLVGGAGYALNHAGITVGFLSIGVDFFQVRERALIYTINACMRVHCLCRAQRTAAILYGMLLAIRLLFAIYAFSLLYIHLAVYYMRGRKPELRIHT